MKYSNTKVRVPTKESWERLMAEIRRLSMLHRVWTVPSAEFLATLKYEII